MSSERAALMKRVGRALVLPPEQSGLTVTRADGTRPIVGALGSDLVADVLRAVREAGGSANVVTQDGARIVVLAMREDGNESLADDVAIHSDARMDMLLALIRNEGSVRTFVIEPGEVLTVDAPHPLLAPA